jgi:tetratricopeptide (TPR) repeat protein
MKKQLIIIAILITTFSTPYAYSQAQAAAQPSAKMKAANELYTQKKFSDSATAYADVIKDEPQNGRAWYLMAMSFHSLGKYEQAIAAFEKNIGINAQNANAMYNIACGYSRLKQADKAFTWLEKAVKTGPAIVSNAAADPDLEFIRTDPRFEKLLETVDRAMKPCKYSAAAREFDFWIGTWDVMTLQGQKAGVNVIQPFAEGCGLMENWTATQGGNGKSINYYDASTQKWYQHWIGSGGGAMRYSGGFKNGALVYEAETTNANGNKVLHRLTFSRNEDNSVRQFAEASNDDGKTWTVSYDFKYVRAK